MAEQPKFDDLGDVVPHRNFTIPFNYIWRSDILRWVPMTSGGSYAGGITSQASAFVQNLAVMPALVIKSLSTLKKQFGTDQMNILFLMMLAKIWKLCLQATDNQNIVIQGLDENFMEKLGQEHLQVQLLLILELGLEYFADIMTTQLILLET